QAAAAAIKAAYDAGKAAGKRSVEIRAAMTAVIDTQVAAGVYVSRHLDNGAVDVRTRDLEPAAKDVLRDLVNESASIRVGLEETRPPHYHLQLQSPPRP